jgi:hypothetical protein
MATGNGGKYNRLAIEAFEPVSEMLDSGRCEPLKAAVHGVALAAVGVCAAYNVAAWIKRRQPHLAVNAVVYCFAVWWERSQVLHHLEVCEPSVGTLVSSFPAGAASIAAAADRDAA